MPFPRNQPEPAAGEEEVGQVDIDEIRFNSYRFEPTLDTRLDIKHSLVDSTAYSPLTMPPAKPNLRSTAIKRILQEHKEFTLDPSDEFAAHPLEDDLFDWHVTLKGAPGGDYDGGQSSLARP